MSFVRRRRRRRRRRRHRPLPRRHLSSRHRLISRLPTAVVVSPLDLPRTLLLFRLLPPPRFFGSSKYLRYTPRATLLSPPTNLNTRTNPSIATPPSPVRNRPTRILACTAAPKRPTSSRALYLV